MISMSKEDETVIMPWVDDLYNGGELIKCKMQIMPCNTVYQYWPIEDLLTGNVPDQDYEKANRQGRKERQRNLASARWMGEQSVSTRGT